MELYYILDNEDLLIDGDEYYDVISCQWHEIRGWTGNQARRIYDFHPDGTFAIVRRAITIPNQPVVKYQEIESEISNKKRKVTVK